MEISSRDILICYKPQLTYSLPVYTTPTKNSLNSQMIERIMKENYNLKYCLDSKWRSAGVQLVRNLTRLYVMTLKAMWRYASRWHAVTVYPGIHFQEISSYVHWFTSMETFLAQTFEMYAAYIPHNLSVFYTINSLQNK